MVYICINFNDKFVVSFGCARGHHFNDLGGLRNKVLHFYQLIRGI